MSTYYTNERNIQMLIALMKGHGIRKVIASPGTGNISFVGSIQYDPYFEIVSAADERSAAYLACGWAAQSGEPVALSCTGATAARNYLPALTEAYYRKLPILAITSNTHLGNTGQLVPQITDRSVLPNDTAKISFQIPQIHSDEDEWDCNVKLNTAMLALQHRGGGPVRLNMVTTHSRNFSVKELPSVRVINRVGVSDIFPEIAVGKVAIFVGAHLKWSDRLTCAVDMFCEKYNGVVLCDQTSNYQGKYRVFPNLACGQEEYQSICRNLELLIHIGDVSGAYARIAPREVWRVNPDGEVRDTYKKLRYIFEMEEEMFFEKYSAISIKKNTVISYYEECQKEYHDILKKIPDLPFSNIWIAQQTLPRISKGNILHLGILNSLRAWNFFEPTAPIYGYSNTGGFGIDGGVSTLIGASFADPNKLFFGVVGDLAFFYDMNVLGNRHAGNNIRVILVNNGCGTEFTNYSHPGAAFKEDANLYIAAAGHYGNQSRMLVKHYAQDLGFEYMSAETKEEYLANLNRFTTPEITEKPMLFEVFTNSKDESDALRIMNNLEASALGTAEKKAKDVIRKVAGQKGIDAIKKIVKR